MTIFCNRDDCPEVADKSDALRTGWKRIFKLWYCPKHEHKQTK